jgi:hypothetical protein
VSASQHDHDAGERRVVGFLGVGLDNPDGDQRLTHSEHFFLVGGSRETHERMQQTAIQFTKALRQRGKKLEETRVDEVMELFREAQE